MNADNSHAERQILNRVIEYYYHGRAQEPTLAEREHRAIAVAAFMTLARIDEIRAAELLADALARRASNKLGE